MRIALVALAAVACSSDIPEPATGGRILGTVRYAGDVHHSLQRPGIQVLAYPRFPPSAPPHGVVVVEPEDGDFTSVPYELRNLPAFDGYKVFARLAELADPEGGSTDLPLGGYPSFCALARAGFTVAVGDDGPTLGIDIDLYDRGGLDDPCNTPSGDVCPAPGSSTLDVTVVSTRVPSAADTLLVALFDVFPSTTPAAGYLIPGTDVQFPERVIDNAIVPGSYPAFYSCLDIGSNNLDSICGSEDAYVLHTDPLDFPADRIVSLTADLDTATLTVDGVNTPASFGCP